MHPHGAVEILEVSHENSAAVGMSNRYIGSRITPPVDLNEKPHTVLFLFNINKASKNGVVMEPAVGQTSGTVRFISGVTSIYELV
ncbi:hypothetical protein DFH08DRAFT_967508 [Mycena albidolilacea]|uniref:Uncharacterized protein n=1 Tax=Mycena albidolilacea TaxID=1033008 RepID=A0AAD7EK02_9AGAR|nr:hypothetical protein DFH08DRAFT_967508 [Mycena albidolilacea]